MEDVSKLFEPFLLKDVVIRSDSNVLRRGILKTFAVKQFYIRLTLQNIKSGNDSLYEMPYPYDISLEDDKLTMNYKISNFSPDPNHQMMARKLQDSFKTNPSRLHDKVIYLLPFADTIV